MGRILKGYWNCDFCNSKKIGGDIRICPHCGKPRGENTKFYLDSSSEYVNETVVGKVSRNPDWVCGFCNHLNPDQEKQCLSCGAKRSNTDMNYFQNREKQEAKKNGLENHNTAWVRREPKRRNKNSFLSIILFVGILAFIINGLVKLGTPKTVDMTVFRVAWERLIQIEEYKTVEESNWYLPSEGRLVSTNIEIRSYNQVLDHYETRTREHSEQVISHYETQVVGMQDLGNGYFQEITTQVPVYRTEYWTETYEEPVYRSEPVYDTMYYYEIERWIHARDIKTKGNDKNPEWGKIFLAELERESSRNEKYILVLKDKEGKEYNMSLAFGQWNEFEIGQQVKTEVSYNGKVEILEQNKEGTEVK